MSLKKTSNNGIFKKRLGINQFLTEKSIFQSLQTNDSNKSSSDIETKKDKRRKCRYKQLEFSQDGSSKGSSLYQDRKKKSNDQKNVITIIQETDTEGEAEGRDQLITKKMTSIAERFQPKVVLQDVINLCSDSDNNAWPCYLCIGFFWPLLFHPPFDIKNLLRILKRSFSYYYIVLLACFNLLTQGNNIKAY